MTPNILPDGPTLHRHTAPSEPVKTLVTGPDAFATVLLCIAVDAFGPECLHDPADPTRGPWHPATFRAMLAQHVGAPVPDLTLDKLMAAVVVVTTDLFFADVHRFISLANVLAGSEFSPEQFDKADAAECAWAITEALILSPPDPDEKEPFCDDVRRYVGAVLKDEGFVSPPDVLRIAIDGDDADRVRYTFADDPAAFAAIRRGQAAKAAEIETVIRDALTALATQLHSLALQNGSTAELEKGIARALTGTNPARQTGPEFVLD